MIEQGSKEWFAQRCGKVTASRIADIMAKTKAGYSASRKNYLAQLVVERMTGQVAESYSNAAMQWGTEKEPEARAAYEFMSGNSVKEAEFIQHPDITDAGASPDGYVNDDGLIEIKCPNTATHIETLLGASIDGKYILQMQFQMACTGRHWCDFVSYDPRMPPDLSLFIKRVERDQKTIYDIHAEIFRFLNELTETIEKLNNLEN
jgi:putative phage-type endonuclease